MTLTEVGGYLRDPLTTAGDMLVRSATGVQRLALASQPYRNVMAPPYSAVGNGVADDSAAIQAAIDDASAAGGGIVLLPGLTFRANLVLKSGVTIVGASGRFGYLPGTVTQTKIVGAVTGVVIDTPVTTVRGCGVAGINLQGLGAGTAMKGIWFRDVEWGFIKGVQLNLFADEGVLVDSSSGACVLEDVFTTNCVLNRSRAAVIGAIDIAGADHYLHRVEAGISGSIEGAVQSASLYCVAVAYRGANGWISDSNAEISDIGFYVSGSRNRFTGSRGDLNYGHGWQVVGAGNQFTGCLGLNNSQDTTNTYSNFQATSASAGNLYTGCLTGDTLTKKAKYGFEDLVSGATTKNQYSNCLSTTALTAQYFAASSNGSSFFFPVGATKILTANSATPDVTGYTHFITANSSTTTITAFTGLVPGQRLVILCNDANTTIQHNGSTITLMGAGNKKLRSGAYYEFVANNTTAVREIAPIPLGVTADVGDAAKTLQARVNEETQKWATTLTADRAVTLSTTGAFSGAKFHIVRPAGGAFNLNIGSGPLKALAAGQWADVEHDGSAWFLSRFGSL